jgi:hypothetical protein
VSNNGIAVDISDNGGRRTGIERRYFSYSTHIPERRCDDDRRCEEDRRSGQERREMARIIDFAKEQKKIDRRNVWNMFYQQAFAYAVA